MIERNLSVDDVRRILEDPDGRISQSRDKAILYRRFSRRRDNLIAAVVVELNRGRIVVIAVLVNFEVKR